MLVELYLLRCSFVFFFDKMHCNGDLNLFLAHFFISHFSKNFDKRVRMKLNKVKA